MRVQLWGTRGSVAAPGPETARYGGNTSCVEVVGAAGTRLVLDAGTGIRRLGSAIPPGGRVDVLLTHLHMDHLQGLGFFAPLYDPSAEVHLWGPASQTLGLAHRLRRYLSPPLFPVHLRDLPCRLTIHEVGPQAFEVGEFTVHAEPVCHPGPTVGYRLVAGGRVLTYLPDHEPALGARTFPGAREWTSGYALAAGANLLIHDCQYADGDYAAHLGWGHSAISHAIAFAELAQVRELVTFHHDPAYNDTDIDALLAQARVPARLKISPGTEGATFEI